MANPFDVNPLGGLNLGNTYANAVEFGQRQDDRLMQQGIQQEDRAMMLEDRAMQQQALQAKAQQQEQFNALAQKAMNGDYEAGAQMYLLDPTKAKQVDEGLGIKDENERKQIAGWLEGYLTSKNKQGYLKETAKTTPWTWDDEWGNMSEEEQLPLANLIAGRVLNKDQLAMLGGANKDMTTKERDFSTYLKLQKENPSNAEKFGRGAGFIAESSPKDLFKVIENESGGMIKVFRDGTQEDMNMGEVVKTGDMSKPMTPKKAQKILSEAKEYQSKAAGFAMRLRDSIDSMNALTKSGKIDAGRVALLNKALGDGSIANISLTSEEQQYIVEAKDALFAVLRPETGAAITDQELAQYAKIYLPQAGDSQATIATKIKKLENQFDSLRSRAPEIYDASRVIIGEGPSMYDTTKTTKTVNWTDL